MPAGPVHPGEWLIWRLTYIAGGRGLGAGGGVEIAWHPSLPPGMQILGGDWTPPQTDDPGGPGYTTAHASGRARVALEFPSPAQAARARDPREKPQAGGPRTMPRRTLRVRVVEGQVEPGERIEIVYGNPSQGSRGAQAQAIAQEGVPIQAWIDEDGQGKWRALGECPTVRIIGGEAAGLRLIAPSLVGRAETFDLAIVALDAHGNPADSFVGPVKLTGEVDGLPVNVPTTDWCAGLYVVPGLRARRTGPLRIAAQSGRLQATSSPVVVRAGRPPSRIYWADLHGHTWLSDGLRSPHEYYRYARDTARLDVAAATDHDWRLEGRWDEARRAAAWYHQPGRFVSLLGYEWTSAAHGHKGIYFPGEDGPLLTAQACPTPRDLHRALEGTGALTISLHPAGGPAATNWDGVDPHLEPLVELYSCHGDCESPESARPLWRPALNHAAAYVRDALARGLQLGFTAASDTHLSDPGNPSANHSCYGQPWRPGLAAVLAPELTREAICEALWQRRTYATTGERIYLYFAVEGQPMGAELEACGHLRIRAMVHGTSQLAAVDLVRDGEVRRRVSSPSLDGEWTWRDDPGPGRHYYYLRVTQGDQEMAWSSPIWVQS